jgi:hypothetical protein
VTSTPPCYYARTNVAWTLSRQGALHDTLMMVLSDNGATAEGGPLGTRSPVPAENGMPDSPEAKLAALAEWGGPTTSPCYAAGWAMAGNTPNRWYKQFTHEGGTRAPLVVHWPAGIAGPRGVRSQFHHAVDIMPTVLEASGTAMPSELAGHRQRPLDGVSFGYTLPSGEQATRKHVQYFEMLGHRAIWADGWKAVATHWSTRMLQFVPETTHELHDGDFAADRWELYNLDEDFSECQDRAQDEPGKVAELVEVWWAEAQRNQVLPLSEQLSPAHRPEGIFEPRAEYVYYGRLRLPEAASPDLHDRPHTITAVLDVPPEGAKGVIISSGGPEGGFVLLVSGRRAHYVTNLLGSTVGVARSEQVLPTGRVTLSADVAVPVPGRVLVTLSVDGVRGPPVELTASNPVSFDVRGRGLQVGSGLPGVWPSYVGPLEFNGDIVEVSVSCHGEKRPDAQAQARVAFIEQ